MSRRRPAALALSRPVLTLLLLVAVLLALLLGCSTEEPAPSGLSSPPPRPTSPGSGTASVAAADDPIVVAPVEPDLDRALSTPREDSVYPGAGDPRVDALLYDLDLAWDPAAERLTGEAAITFRATRDSAGFRLGLGDPLRVGEVSLDGEPVRTRRRGDLLVVRAPVVKGRRYELVVPYAGMPAPAPAPTTRGDFSTIGFTVTGSGEVWTMQEPYGAFTWYPVNDQPSDKALYDITVTVPAPWTGIANGRLTRLTTADGDTTTSWQLVEPASSYLITLAIGDYEHSSDTTSDQMTVDYWIPRGMVGKVDQVRTAAASLEWIEDKLGDYPFDSLGLVVTESQSAMETQTMVTLGNTDYVLSPQVVAHELVHQWYGDQVSPADWRDVWLNEGMTMLLQWIYEDEHDIRPLRETLRGARAQDQALRDRFGPPGSYDPQQFGASNVYYPPALMWNELRLALGDERFYAVAGSWLRRNDGTSASREQLYRHWERATGRDLGPFFDAWITGRTTPRPGVPGPPPAG